MTPGLLFYICLIFIYNRRPHMKNKEKIEEEIFKGKTFSGLMEDIYNNSAKKEAQINDLIKQLQPMIKNMGDATVLVA